MAENKQIYSKDKVIDIYTGSPKLFKAESKLIQKYKTQLSNAVFLDIGIGGGRTTQFIYPMVFKYYGIDYSPSFVSYVSTKYKGYANIVIEYADARDLSQYASNFFDFILFSFNGIDCVNLDDRQKIIKECFRLLKPMGHYWFSFHNIKSLSKLYSFQWPKNPFNWINEWERLKKVKRINGKMYQYKDNEYCILRDGEAFFEAEVMYYKPSGQLEMLLEIGFEDVQYYNVQSGKLLCLQGASLENIDWIYVDCIKSK